MPKKEDPKKPDGISVEDGKVSIVNTKIKVNPPEPSSLHCPTCEGPAVKSEVPGDESSITLLCGTGHRHQVGAHWTRFLKVFLLAAALSLAGCTQMRQFGRGFSEATVEEVQDEITSRIDKRIDKLTEDIPKSVPGAGDLGTWGGLGALAAYLVGSVVKGKVREMNGNGKHGTV